MEEGRTLESVPYLWNAVQLQPQDCNAHYNLGFALLRLLRYAEAREPLRQALSCYQREGHRDDWIADAHLNLGAVELNLGRPATAAEHYRAAYAIVPSASAAAGLRAAQVGQGSARPRPR
jgi:tetratricopeptide (TPR) repeat protein